MFVVGGDEVQAVGGAGGGYEGIGQLHGVAEEILFDVEERLCQDRFVDENFDGQNYYRTNLVVNSTFL